MATIIVIFIAIYVKNTSNTCKCRIISIDNGLEDFADKGDVIHIDYEKKGSKHRTLWNICGYC